MMKKILIVVAVAVALLSGNTPVFADQEQKIKEIRALVDLIQGSQLVDALLPAIMAQIRPLVRQANPGISDEYYLVLEEEISDVFRESIDVFIDQTVPIYDANFSEEEISYMLKFYAAPMGQSVLKKLPKVALESMALGQQWGQAVGLKAQERIQERLKKDGYKL